MGQYDDLMLTKSQDVGKQAPGGSGGSDAASHMAGFSTVAIFSAVMLLILA